MRTFHREIRILLVNPETPASYWGMQEASWFIGARAAHVPLSLITVAALLPHEWQLRLVDMNVTRLRDKDIAWADAVLITGMIIQRNSLGEVLRRCHEYGTPTVVGGPFVSSSPEAKELALATALVIGEAEDENVAAALIADLQLRRLRRVYRALSWPHMSASPVPRYDLLRRDAYSAMSIQVSRGCPHACEFCNVRMLFGRHPRYKSPQQVISELQAIYDTEYRGNIFFVDDNFIGNTRRAVEILHAVDAWQTEHGRPFLFFTETDIGLARRDRLVDLMVRAGFFAVFIGFESSSDTALMSASKTQNVGVDAAEAVRHLRKKGLLVYGGFIVGFDSDGPECARHTYDLIERCSIDFAMAGMLIAIPGTPLERRLREEGRLTDNGDEGDQFVLANVMPKGMTRLELIGLYRKLIERLYRPKHYFERAYAALAEWKQGAVRHVTGREYVAALRSIVRQGIFSSYGPHYWRFMLKTLLAYPNKIPRAFAMAICGHHLIRYTRRVVIPRLRKAERALLSEGEPETKTT